VPAHEENHVTLELRHISKRVGGETHIHDTSVTFAEDGFNILLGTTLAGKTTLMQLMAGLERPTTGEVWFNGQDVSGVAVQKRNVSMVYQQFINYPNFTVYENIASPLRVAGVKAADIDTRVRRMADLLRLTPLLSRRPGELSGGQQQRTALARALVKDAGLVLFDEPLANLDFKLREELRDELPKLFAGRRCTVVFATSDPTEALLLGGHTATLHEGRVTAFGPTGTVYRRPADLRAAQAFSHPPINISPVEKRGDMIVLSDAVRWQADAAMRQRPDGRYTVGLRPHYIGAGERGTTAIDGRVLITEISGSESVIHFAHAGLKGEGLTWVSQSHGVRRLEVGAMARFHMDVDECMYFDADGKRIAP
jgi:glycerol transport system ATP-binding protein